MKNPRIRMNCLSTLTKISNWITKTDIWHMINLDFQLLYTLSRKVRKRSKMIVVDKQWQSFYLSWKNALVRKSTRWTIYWKNTLRVAMRKSLTTLNSLNLCCQCLYSKNRLRKPIRIQNQVILFQKSLIRLITVRLFIRFLVSLTQKVQLTLKGQRMVMSIHYTDLNHPIKLERFGSAMETILRVAL
jgi:hypothetical protein